MAVGYDPQTEKYAFFIVNGRVAYLETDADDTATAVTLSQYDQQGFLQEHQLEPTPIFVQTSQEALKKTYIGQTITDY